MDVPLWLQYVVIALAIVVSVVVVVRKQFPRFAVALRKRLALWLLRDTRPAALRALGKRMAPVVTAGVAGCDGCDSCGD